MDLPINLIRNNGKDDDVPLHRQLYSEIRKAILTGRLRRKQRIPSSRYLAKSLEISRTTVTNCYDQLQSEGYIETVMGSGTFVCSQLPDELLVSSGVEGNYKINSPQIILSEYGVSLKNVDTSRRKELDLSINFSYGCPALDMFPMKIWRKLLSRHCSFDSDWLNYASNTLGDQGLREAIAIYISRFRAVKCEPEQILITNGTQQALSLIVRLLVNKGDVIALEDPGYPSARKIFLSQEAQLLPIAVDSDGLIVRELVQHNGSCPSLVYITPSHQFPTGAILSLPRRLELLNWAQQTGALIIEDDYDSEYRYGEKPIPSLQGLDTSQSVIYVGTFSKVLFPSLRIGYIVLPPKLVPVFNSAKWLTDRQLPTLEQLVLADFIQEGHLERHTRRMRSLYENRRNILVEELNKEFGKQVTILGEKAGIHIMVKFHTNKDDEEIVKSAASKGVGIFPASPHYLHGNSKGEFIFGYAQLNEKQIKEGIKKLALTNISN
jgi:GntR family transcriptional regulator / MocR family aminotransferase